MPDEEYHLLRVHLSPHIDDSNEHGWEELTNTAMSHLLKTCLSKGTGGGNKGAGATNINSQIKNMGDTSKLKQNITMVCDRISKGGKIEL